MNFRTLVGESCPRCKGELLEGVTPEGDPEVYCGECGLAKALPKYKRKTTPEVELEIDLDIPLI